MTKARSIGLAVAVLAALSTPGLAGELTYLAHAPSEPSPNPPLIVLMHGSNANENDLIGLWQDLPSTFVVISPRAPFKGFSGGFQWYRKDGAEPRADDLAASRKIVDDILTEAVTRFKADPKRLFIGGFSQGAIMTYEIALKEPGRFRGAAVLSGILFASAVASLDKVDRTHEAFFVAHGTADKVIPFSAATSARDSLGRLGVLVSFHAYQGMAHTVGPEETADLKAWLDERAR